MRDATTGADVPIEQITAFINYVSRLATSTEVRRRIAEAAERLVTPSELDALRVVGAAGPMTFTGLAETLELDRTTISRTAGRLLELGLLRRETDRDDKRKAWLEVTPAGHSMLDQMQTVSKHYYKIATSEWTEDERSDLGRMLERLQDCLARLDFDEHGWAIGLKPRDRRGTPTTSRDGGGPA